MPANSHSVFGGKGLLVATPDAIQAPSYIFFSARYGVNLDTDSVPRTPEDLPEEARKMYSSSRYIDIEEWPITAQTWWIYEAFRRILEPLGASIQDLVRTNTYFRDLEKFPAMERARAAILPVDPPPSTVLEVPFGFFPGGVDVAIEGVAVLPGGGSRDVIRSRLGTGSHYSWGIRTNDMVWAAGQTPSHPLTGRYVHRIGDLGLEGSHLATGNHHVDEREGPVSAQAWITYRRVRTILEDAGVSLNDVTHEKIFLKSMKHLPAVERVRREIYRSAEQAPPSLYVQVVTLGRTPDCLMEVDVVASSAERVIFSGPTDGLGRLSAAGALGGPFLSLGGWVARDPESGRVIRGGEELGERRKALGGEEDSLAVQALWIYDTLGLFLKDKGSSLEELLKVDLYVKETAPIQALDAVHRTVFPGGPPAVSVIPMESIDPDPDVQIKISGIANRPE